MLSDAGARRLFNNCLLYLCSSVIAATIGVSVIIYRILDILV